MKTVFNEETYNLYQPLCQCSAFGSRAIIILPKVWLKYNVSVKGVKAKVF